MARLCHQHNLHSAVFINKDQKVIYSFSLLVLTLNLYTCDPYIGTIEELAKEVFEFNSRLTETLKELRDLKDMVAKIRSTETAKLAHVISVQNSEPFPEPLKEIEDLKPFEDLLREDMDKYFDLVNSFH